MKLRKMLAMLAVICMLATMIPFAAVVSAEGAEPTFSKLQLQLIHRLPSVADTDAKSALYIYVSGDGQNWSEGYQHTTADSGKWLCDTLPTIDLTELAKNVTGDKLYIKIGMGAGDKTWCAIHQLRVVGTYADTGAETELVWDKYESLTPVSGDAPTCAAAVVAAVPGIVDANNVSLGSCVVDGCGKTAIVPYHAGSFTETNGYITYGFDLANGGVIQPEEKVCFEFLGRMPGDANGENKVQVMVGTDGQTWTEAALMEGARDDHGDSTYLKADITKYVDLNAYNLYVKVNLQAYLAEWCSARQIRVTKGTETLLHVIYDDMANGSDDYKKSPCYYDSANMQLRGTYDTAATADPNGLTLLDTTDGQDGGSLGNSYITYKIVLKECAHEYTNPCDQICAVCGELTNPDAAHTVKHVEAKDPTCTELGNIEYWTCEDCGYAWLDEACTLNTNLKAVILPMAHGELTHVEAKDATCTELGNIEYWYCEDCGYAWLDEACTLNTNLRAVVLPMADHSYDNDYDVDCNVCGGIRTVEMPITSAGTSISEDVSGVAALFTINVDGLAIKEGTKTVADYSNATVNGYKLIDMGVIASNNVEELTIPAKYLFELDAENGTATYAARIINIPADKYDVEITFRSYFVIEIDGVETTVYGDTVTASYNGVVNG